jgi:hypothetical protein
MMNIMPNWQFNCNFSTVSRRASGKDLRGLTKFPSPGDGVIGFEIEVRPILLDPLGGIIDVAEPSRW